MTVDGDRVSFWDDEMFLTYSVVMVTHSCEYAKNHRTGRFKR